MTEKILKGQFVMIAVSDTFKTDSADVKLDNLVICCFSWQMFTLSDKGYDEKGQLCLLLLEFK